MTMTLAGEHPVVAEPHAGAGYRLISIVVPLRNERNDICEILRRMRTVSLPLDREIIVVNDASSDGTDKVLSVLEDSTVRVVTHRAHLGRTAAVHTGLAAARGDLVLIQDADLRYNPDDWAGLIAPVLAGHTNVVYGSRLIGAQEAVSIAEWAADRLVGLLAALLFNRTLTDLDATKLMDRSVLDDLGFTNDPIRSRGIRRFEFNAEVTARLLRAGERIYEVPVTYAGRRPRKRRRKLWLERMSAGWMLFRLRFERPGRTRVTPRRGSGLAPRR